MALLSDALKEKRFDVRMTERSLNKGTIESAELDKFVKSLPDDAEQGEMMDLDAMFEELPSRGQLKAHHN